MNGDIAVLMAHRKGGGHNHHQHSAQTKTSLLPLKRHDDLETNLQRKKEDPNL